MSKDSEGIITKEATKAEKKTLFKQLEKFFLIFVSIGLIILILLPSNQSPFKGREHENYGNLINQIGQLGKEINDFHEKIEKFTSNETCNCNINIHGGGTEELPWLKYYVGGPIKNSEKKNFTFFSIEDVLQAPIRDFNKPYIVELDKSFCSHGHCSKVALLEALKTRDDIIWIQHNLGHKIVDLDITGVTIPSNLIYKGLEWNPKMRDSNKMFSFKGWCSHTKLNENKLVQIYENSKDITLNNIDFDCVPYQERNDIDELLIQNHPDFVLISLNDARWSQLLMEAIGSCSIPFIVSDGLSLPFEQIIDWTKLSIRVSELTFESQVKDIRDITQLLPDDKDWILKTRLKICKINDLFFRNFAARENGFWMSVRSWQRRSEAKYSFAELNANCKDALRSC